jgi:hypothetical protein
MIGDDDDDGHDGQVGYGDDSSTLDPGMPPKMMMMMMMMIMRRRRRRRRLMCVCVFHRLCGTAVPVSALRRGHPLTSRGPAKDDWL